MAAVPKNDSEALLQEHATSPDEEFPVNPNADPSERFLALKARRRAEAARNEQARSTASAEEDYRLFRGDTSSSEAFRPFNYGLRER